MIFVPQHVADAHNLRPRDVRVARLELWRNTAGRFGNDLNAALNAVTEKPIRAEVVERLASRGLLHAFDRIENGAKGRVDEPLRQKTRSAEASIFSRSSGSRLS